MTRPLDHHIDHAALDESVRRIPGLVSCARAHGVTGALRILKANGWREMIREEYRRILADKEKARRHLMSEDAA